MSKFSKCAAVGVASSVLIAIGWLSAYQGGVQPSIPEDFTAPFFDRPKVARAERKTQVVEYFDTARRLAETIAEDPVMIEAFAAL